MKLAPLTYRVAHWADSREVRGYAIQLPPPFAGLRFCVRKSGRQWFVDHYDSGIGANGNITSTYSRRDAVERLVLRLHAQVEDGTLRKQFDRYGYGWCLDEAGL